MIQYSWHSLGNASVTHKYGIIYIIKSWICLSTVRPGHSCRHTIARKAIEGSPNSKKLKIFPQFPRNPKSFPIKAKTTQSTQPSVDPPIRSWKLLSPDPKEWSKPPQWPFPCPDQASRCQNDSNSNSYHIRDEPPLHLRWTPRFSSIENTLSFWRHTTNTVPESYGHLGNRVGFSVSFHFSLHGWEIFKRIRQEMQYTFSKNVTNGKFDVCVNCIWDIGLR